MRFIVRSGIPSRHAIWAVVLPPKGVFNDTITARVARSIFEPRGIFEKVDVVFREEKKKNKVKGVFVLIFAVGIRLKSTLFNYLKLYIEIKKKYVFIGRGLRTKLL